MNKARGSDRERRVADQLRADGWVVYRSAGSHGCADLVALRAGYPPMLIQVKSNARGPFSHFPPAERRQLEHEAIAAGATPVLCHWPPRSTPIFYDRNVWPYLDRDHYDALQDDRAELNTTDGEGRTVADMLRDG